MTNSNRHNFQLSVRVHYSIFLLFYERIKCETENKKKRPSIFVTRNSTRTDRIQFLVTYKYKIHQFYVSFG